MNPQEILQMIDTGQQFEPSEIDKILDTWQIYDNYPNFSEISIAGRKYVQIKSVVDLNSRLFQIDWLFGKYEGTEDIFNNQPIEIRKEQKI
ncbi:MAG: hypothetical protein FWG64_01495 [Firmicutes bacterium]|nr:hypothetical protein [Bacillota bacterium]